MGYLMNSDLKRFIVVGSITVLIDLSVYYFFLGITNINTSKTIGFLSGMVFAYYMNNSFTFKHFNMNLKNFIQFMFLYFISLCINLKINYELYELTQLILLAFIISTATSAMINYLGMKFWIFKTKGGL